MKIVGTKEQIDRVRTILIETAICPFAVDHNECTYDRLIDCIDANIDFVVADE